MSRAAPIVLVALAFTTAACTCGTLTQGELEAKYGAPKSLDSLFVGAAAVELAELLRQEVGSQDLKLKSLSLHESIATAEVANPKAPKQIVRYTFREGDLVDTSSAGTLDRRRREEELFDLHHVPLETLPSLIAKAISELGYQGAWARLVNVSKDRRDGRLTMDVHIESRDDSGFVRFDGGGGVLHRSGAAERPAEAVPEPPATPSLFTGGAAVFAAELKTELLPNAVEIEELKLYEQRARVSVRDPEDRKAIRLYDYRKGLLRLLGRPMPLSKRRAKSLFLLGEAGIGRIPQLVAEARRKLGREDAEVSRIVFSRSRGRRKKPGRVKATVYLDDNGSTKAFALDAQGDRSEERKKRRRKKRRRRKRR